MAYRVELEQEAEDALDDMRAADRTRVAQAIYQQLRHQPSVATRNRKPMRPGGPAGWELREPPFRAYYDVDEARQVVSVVAIVRKDRETVEPTR
jgi:mRNA-degrading endonuclease RelE of RelBE toxin-antitoxin system